MGAGVTRGWFMGGLEKGVFERIADGTLLGMVGNGGTGGAGDDPRSRGLYAETAGFPSSAADSEYADDSVPILLRDG